MASAWGDSWGDSWNGSWGALPVPDQVRVREYGLPSTTNVFVPNTGGMGPGQFPPSKRTHEAMVKREGKPKYRKNRTRAAILALLEDD
jgi:hypothetical protein